MPQKCTLGSSVLSPRKCRVNYWGKGKVLPHVTTGYHWLPLVTTWLLVRKACYHTSRIKAKWQNKMTHQVSGRSIHQELRYDCEIK